MSKALSEESADLLCQLIKKITKLPESSQDFEKIRCETLDRVRKSDTMYFLAPKDIETEIEGMGRKFELNGFRRHAQHLRTLFRRAVHENVPKNDLNARLNAIKLLLLLSDRPTEAFWQNPEKFEAIMHNTAPEIEEVVDWVAYLKEGVEEWAPLSENSDLSDSENEEVEVESVSETRPESKLVILENPEPEPKSFEELRLELTEICQNEWFNGEPVVMEPPSDWYEANVGILWERHLSDQVKGIIDLDELTVISEYKVMREIMWQLFQPHDSTVFRLSGNKLVPKPNVTIASLRSACFENYMKQFITYVDLIHDLRTFCNDVLGDSKAPETYKSYAFSVYSIIYRVMSELCTIEKEIKRQEDSMTLLKLSLELDRVFEPLFKLKRIQNEVLDPNYRNQSNMSSSLGLLTKLRRKFDYCLDKMEQNLVLSLYLDSLYYYCNIMEGWLVNGYLLDLTSEFPIENGNHSGGNEIDLQSERPPEDWTMNYRVRKEVSEDSAERDDLIGLICDRVLEIGRNVHFLRWVKKYDSITKSDETIHEEFTRNVLSKLETFFDVEKTEIAQVDLVNDGVFEVREDDGFLLEAFENLTGMETKNEVRFGEMNDYFEKLERLDTHLYPWQKMPEMVFNSILMERFSISGLMVKNVLVDRFKLDKTLDFLRLIFLFENDIISPFYRKLFHKIESAKRFWGSSVPLTFNLHDALMDAYPDFYEFASIVTKSDWYQASNSLEACAKVDLNYAIRWPLSIVITEEQIGQYGELFRFILKIKWALYTMNHLDLQVLESDRRLLDLRFKVLSLVSDLHHFVFRCVFNVSESDFQLAFEKADNLKSTVGAHAVFIGGMHREIGKIVDGSGYKKILECVQMLKLVWDRPGSKSGRVLNQCNERYKAAFGILNPIIHPTFIV